VEEAAVLAATWILITRLHGKRKKTRLLHE
jgi:hypothetical protein